MAANPFWEDEAQWRADLAHTCSRIPPEQHCWSQQAYRAWVCREVEHLVRMRRQREFFARLAA